MDILFWMNNFNRWKYFWVKCVFETLFNLFAVNFVTGKELMFWPNSLIVEKCSVKEFSNSAFLEKCRILIWRVFS